MACIRETACVGQHCAASRRRCTVTAPRGTLFVGGAHDDLAAFCGDVVDIKGVRKVSDSPLQSISGVSPAKDRLQNLSVLRTRPLVSSFCEDLRLLHSQRAQGRCSQADLVARRTGTSTLVDRQGVSCLASFALRRGDISTHSVILDVSGVAPTSSPVLRSYSSTSSEPSLRRHMISIQRLKRCRPTRTWEGGVYLFSPPGVQGRRLPPFSEHKSFQRASLCCRFR
jgi:hypothetical protein